jgi:adenylyltransferase/sulfurtransferase
VRDRAPWIHGVVGASGSACVARRRTPCLRCWLPMLPQGESETSETEGVLLPAVAAIAAFQSAQALKLLAGRVESVCRGVFAADVWRDRTRCACRAYAVRRMPVLRRAAVSG